MSEVEGMNMEGMDMEGMDMVEDMTAEVDMEVVERELEDAEEIFDHIHRNLILHTGLVFRPSLSLSLQV